MSANYVSLQQLHTFGLPVNAKRVVIASQAQEIRQAWFDSRQEDLPFLLLGEGSNVLFLEDFAGIVVFNRLKGVEINEQADSWQVHVGAGENWHQLIQTLLGQGVYGLENLALIPGCAGSAPIQNIGAYGLEFKDICNYVELLNLDSGEVVRLSAAQCQFGYRESLFKHQYRQGYAVIAVGLKLSKKWQPRLNYGELKNFDPQTVTPQQVFDSVCHMRQSKLPNPAVTGNAGSFFKNPLVSRQQGEAILRDYPNAPVYPVGDETVKLAAGWLIDQCQLKGKQIGGAMVHPKQALVIVNYAQAIPQDVVALASLVQKSVHTAFSVLIEPEVRFIARSGEVNAMECLS